MLSILDKIYTEISGRSRLHSLFRFIIRRMANIFIPISFQLNPVKHPIANSPRGKKVIVSLTSFPQRISSVWIVIECMLRQSIKPDKILLYLSIQQFPNKHHDLPSNLIGYINKGYLDVRFVEDDLKSHKKYFYSFQEYPNDYVVLVDDDLFYVKSLIEDLLKLSKLYPHTICCHRAHRVGKNDDGSLKPYKEWKFCYGEEGPTSEIFHTSGGGTLYEPKYFGSSLYDIDVLKENCFYADDVWLNLHAFLFNIKVVKGSYYSIYIPITSLQSEKLSTANVAMGGNDLQIQNLIRYFQVTPEKLFHADGGR